MEDGALGARSSPGPWVSREDVLPRPGPVFALPPAPCGRPELSEGWQARAGPPHQLVSGVPHEHFRKTQPPESPWDGGPAGAAVPPLHKGPVFLGGNPRKKLLGHRQDDSHSGSDRASLNTPLNMPLNRSPSSFSLFPLHLRLSKPRGEAFQAPVQGTVVAMAAVHPAWPRSAHLGQ